MLKVSFENKDLDNNEAIAFIIGDNLKMDSETLLTDQKYHGLISKTIKDERIFKPEYGHSKVLTTTNKDGEIRYLILIALGSEDNISAVKIEEIGGKIHTIATSCKASSVGIKLPNKIGSFKQENIAALMGGGALLASYRFDKYHTMKSNDKKFITEDFDIVVDNHDAALKLFEEQKSLALGVFFARDCINEVPNILYPESYAERIMDKLEPIGVDVEVLGESQMRSLGMGALLGVGQGSSNESKMVIMKYNGLDDDSDPICFVGKGVTFDTGGISLKPAAGMGDMKYDMGGSAAVVGAIKALALRNAKVNVVGIVGLVENMPGGNAQRPGDVVRTMSGQTVEVLNTDAEGRLVLCDCVTYVQENFKPACIVDLATLTGAILISLGNTYAGCYANDDELANKLIASSFKTNEKLWRMPLHPDYNEMIKSPIADIANIGSEKGLAGSSTAAHFIGRFIKEGVKWAHLDIAGVAWDRKGANPICPKGAVGFGVRLLNQFVKDNYESK
jgi:leucyl aminopeptidase